MKKENKIANYITKNGLDMPKIVDEYYNYISKIIKNSNNISLEDEEEMISDVFLVLWKNQEKLDKNANLSPYIAGITKNIIYKKYRSINKNMQLSKYEGDIVDSFNIEKIIEEREIDACIANSLQNIGNTEYEIFTKFYYQGKKVKDIAKEMNLSLSNVKTKLHRTRNKVKEILKDSVK